MPGIESKSVEFFYFTSMVSHTISVLCLKRLKRLLHLLGSGVPGKPLCCTPECHFFTESEGQAAGITITG